MGHREERGGKKALYRFRDLGNLSHAIRALGSQGGGGQAQAEPGEEEEMREARREGICYT